MKEVEADLYEFLRDKEVHIYPENNDEYIMSTWIPFDEIKDFINIVGAGYFADDGGVDVKLQSDGIYIELNDFIEGLDQNISSYSYCIDNWDTYKNGILKLEQKRED